MMKKLELHATTILAVAKDGKVALGSDGQVTLDKTIMKHKTKKVRKLKGGKVVAGFAGSAADGLALFEKFEAKLEEFRGNVLRASVELAKEWRMDKAMRRLEAILIVASKENLLLISGTGDVIEPDDNVLSTGSGSPYAQAAAKAMMKHSPNMTAEEIVREGLTIASEIDIYTNNNFTIEVLE